MKHVKFSITILLCAAVALLPCAVLAGCQEGEAPSSKAEKTDPASDFPDVSLFEDEDLGSGIELSIVVSKKQEALTKEQVKRFEEHYPTVRFRSISVFNQEDNNAPTTLITGDPQHLEDVFPLPSDMINRFIDAQMADPVPSSYDKDVAAANMEPAVDAAKVNGVLYAYPLLCDSTYYLVYDKSVVSDADAATLEGVLAACQKAGKQFVMDVQNGFYACAFPFTGGVQPDGLEEDGLTQQFTDYNEDEAVETLLAFAKLMKQYRGTFVCTDPGALASLFEKGTAAAGFDGIWHAENEQKALDDHFGASKLPTVKVGGKDKPMINLTGYTYLAVNSNSKYPKAAHALAYYLSSETCQRERTETSGGVPTNKAVQENLPQNDAMRAVCAQTEHSVPQVWIAGTFYESMGKLGNSLYTDETYAEDPAAVKKLLQSTISDIREE